MPHSRPHASYNPGMNPLSTARRSELRAQAHGLTPVVIIGDKGLTEEVITEVDRSLKAHELIKVRVMGGERGDRGTWMQAICERLGAHGVQLIGKILVIFRENPKDKERGVRHEAGEKAKARKPSHASRLKPQDAETTRTSRPRSRTPSPRPESEPRRRRPRTSR
jgi:RNA-binding protein